MEIYQYAVDAESIDVLSKYQITSFFSQRKPITKDDCGKIATKITGTPVSPTLVHGVASYTLAADTPQHPKVVQFRNSPLDLELVKLARKTYGDFVPKCIFYYKLDGVYVYEMDLVPGVALSRAMRTLLAPFGTSLGGLEFLLGVRTSSRWHFHPLHNTFRAQFWKELYGTIGYVSDDDRRAIEIARMFGLFRTHGFDRRPEKPGAMPLAEGEEGFVYLEAFCLPPADPPKSLE